MHDCSDEADLCCYFFLPGLTQPSGVTPEVISESLSVRVSWEAVKYADMYNVSFSEVNDTARQQQCMPSNHKAHVSTDALNTSITVGQDVEQDVTTMLRAYTNYSVTVAAESHLLGTSDNSDPVFFTTPQMSM